MIFLCRSSKSGLYRVQVKCKIGKFRVRRRDETHEGLAEGLGPLAVAISPQRYPGPKRQEPGKSYPLES